MKLITTSNVKISKGLQRGYATAGIHFSPAKRSGYEVCRGRSPGCTDACLNTTGHGVFNSTQESRVRKTLFFFEQRDKFLDQLWNEIRLFVNRSRRKDTIPCFRPNLTSDLPWESIKRNNETLMEAFPDVMFYDYTKIPVRMKRFLSGQFPKNYHLTFSRSENNQAAVENILKIGGNVAVVFRNKLPVSYLGHPVVSGDTDDLRFLDPARCVVGLVDKGKAKHDASGFVLSPDMV